MSSRQGRLRSTVRTAQAALDQITARGQPADPRTFALWYNFVLGESGFLNAAVGEKLAQNGTLSARDVDDIYGNHISSIAVADKIDAVGAEVADEFDQVMGTIETAEGSASGYSANLADLCRRLGTTLDETAAGAVIEGLVRATQKMGSTNARLHNQLQQMWEEVARLRNELDLIRTESMTDALTSLGNRKFFNLTLEKAIAHAHELREQLSLLLGDVDHFKNINDTHGHLVGDRVLRFIALALKRNLKGNEVAARYGGEEFAVILPGTTIDAAVRLADRMRYAVMKGELVRQSTGEKHSSLTISIGVAALHEGATAQSLIEAADVCLYAAKRSGRNCVVSEVDEKLLDAVAR